MYRLAIIASHPVQYQAPWFRALAQVTDLEVFFCHRQDSAGQAAAGFGVEFDWDIPLLEGYKFTWLQNRSPRPDVSRFSGCDTPEIAGHLRDGRFDACLISGWYLKSYLQAFGACRRAGIPILMRGDSRLGTSRSRIRRIAKYLPYRWFLRRIDAHLFVGRANREYLQHYGVPESRLFFAPHFVDNAFFATRAQAARETGSAMGVRRSLEIPEDATVFAFVGKLLPNKRPDDLVRAAVAAHKSNPDIFAIIVGTGPLLAELRQLAAALNAPVRFAGFRNQSELPEYLAASDAVVVSSQSETWGLVVNEGMACGLPAIVSTGTGCAPDLIEQGRTGEQYETGTIEALANAMLSLAQRLETDRPAVARAVASKMCLYSCEVAVRGTVQALEVVAAPARPQASDQRRIMNTRSV